MREVVSAGFKVDFEHIHSVIDNIMYESIEHDIKTLIYHIFTDPEQDFSDHKDVIECANEIRRKLGMYMDAYVGACKYYKNIHVDIKNHIAAKVDELLDFLCTNIKNNKKFKLEDILL